MTAVPIREAATVLLVRDGATGDGPLETLLLHRNPKTVFSPGAHVFPGGAVDDSDRLSDIADVCVGRTDEDASALLGLPSGGLAYWVAAVRECFEEAGVLLAVDDAGDIVSFADPATAERFTAHRHALERGDRTLVDICLAESLRLATDRIHYFSHWITPAGGPRRYDTRFFIAAAPTAQVPLHDDGEIVAHEWMRPADALARSDAGELLFIRPTAHSLQSIGAHGSTADLLAACRQAEASVVLANP